jgi:S1-C subfamily serine protease
LGTLAYNEGEVKKMRKYVNKLLIILVILFPMAAYGANLVNANYLIYVNGEKVNVQPYNLDGTTLLPIRAVSEALGVDIGWTGSSVEINTVDVEELKKACVMIDAQSATTTMQGSAVCWDYGEYLTANHIILNGRTNVKSSDVSDFKIDRINPELDISTLTTSNSVKPVPIGDSDGVKPGDNVILITSPKGSANTVTRGTVQYPSGNNIVVWANLDLGSSGGACFNMKGELIGVVVSGSGFDKAHLVIPINEIRKAF